MELPENHSLSKTSNILLSVVVPAYNEEHAIVQEIRSVRNVLKEKELPHEIIVVDDGSKDQTGRLAEDAGARVIRHRQNRGYGASLKSGIRAAKSDIIVITDTDGTYPVSAIPEMVEKIDSYDMVVGARTGSNVRIPLIRKPAKLFLGWLASYLSGFKIPDLNSGLRVMKKSLVMRFENILPSGFSFTTTITLAMLCNDYLVHYHPIDYRRRIGKSKIKPVDAYRFFVLIIRAIVFFNPLKIFIPAGAVFFSVGAGKFIYDIFQRNISESAVLGIIAGFMLWSLGLLSDQISKIHAGNYRNGDSGGNG